MKLSAARKAGTMKIKPYIYRILTTASCLGLAQTPAFSVTLAGHLEQNRAATTCSAAIARSAAIAGQARTQTDCFPDSYEGAWRCDTVVTDSTVESVQAGEKVVCEVRFVRNDQGQVVSVWKQDGWTEGASSVKAFNGAEAQMDRTSFFSDGSWAAHARGNFTQVNGAAIIAHSVVDQYIDGQYAGRYHTTSILRRENPLADIAIHEIRDDDQTIPTYLNK
jgi:hypothetical protein